MSVRYPSLRERTTHIIKMESRSILKGWALMEASWRDSDGGVWRTIYAERATHEVERTLATWVRTFGPRFMYRVMHGTREVRTS